MAKDYDYSDEVAALKVPTLIVHADADMAPPSHAVEIFKLLDGGLRDGGWMGENRPKGGHALAILPGLTALQPGRIATLRDGHPVIPRRAGGLGRPVDPGGSGQPIPRRFSSTIWRSWLMPVAKPASLSAR